MGNNYISHNTFDSYENIFYVAAFKMILTI